jgi:hypothetical protein
MHKSTDRFFPPILSFICMGIFFLSAHEMYSQDKKVLSPRVIFNNRGDRVVKNNILVPLYKLIKTKDETFSCDRVSLITELDLTGLSEFFTSIGSISLNGQNPDIYKVFIELVDELPFPNQIILNSEIKQQAYQLEITKEKSLIKAISKSGLINGLATLQFEMMQGNGLLQYKKILDWPDFESRMLHINLKNMTPRGLDQVLYRAWRAHFNGIVVSLSNSVKFESNKALWKPLAIEKNDFLKFVQKAKTLGIEIIPQLSLLTHQDKDFIDPSVYPDLMFNERTYDPNNTAVYTLIFDLVDEIQALIAPRAIHIGHDEVVGLREKDKGVFEPVLPSDFLNDVKKINSYLISHDIETWMWGDMLLTPKEFPEMHPGSLNGNEQYALLRTQIPKNIVICDWHYKHYKGYLSKKLTFPSMDAFINTGFEVYGSTYDVSEITKKFSEYAYKLKSQKVKGMIATTWTTLLKGATVNDKQTDYWQLFDKIVEESGQAFWNASKNIPNN